MTPYPKYKPNRPSILRSFALLLLLLVCLKLHAQQPDRILQIQNKLEVLSLENTELKEQLKLEINVTNVTLPNFLIAVSKVHGLNLSVSPDISNITIVNNFSDVTVADLLVFLCKQYDLDIDFTGNILFVKRYIPPVEKVFEKEVLVRFNPTDQTLSLDLQNDALGKVFRKIMDVSGKNLLFSQGMENQPLNLYINNVPFDAAMEKLAVMHQLSFSKSRDGFYLFNRLDDPVSNNSRVRRSLGKSPLNYQVLDTVNKILHVDFINTPIASIIKELSFDLKLDVYTATPLEEAGNVTFNATNILFDDLLTHIFESKQNSSPFSQVPDAQASRPARGNVQAAASLPVHFTFKKENNIYFFGTADQLSLREVEIVQLMYRSVELLSDPSSFSGGYRSAGRTSSANVNFFGSNGQNNFQNQNTNINRRSVNTRSSGFSNYADGAEALVNILPDEIKADLDIKVDFELNSFLVSGPSSNINRFKKFIREIDKPVPVVLIEVMILEVKRSATVETGISWGIGDQPVSTQGKLFPETDLTLGANTVNKIIGGFDGFGSFNIGRVVPDFFATIKAMEENGNIRIRSTPKLSTLNGHRANLSIGETTYYVITNQNFFGSQIPTASEVRNYAPIDAELAVSIKPLVSGNGQVTLDINVIQSDFSGERIEEDAPPGLTSREFSSIIRMQNQDLAILGGLEEKLKNDSGNGVPLLARVPVIKWLFSKRRREDTKQKLTILIKPTVIY
ncbi:type II secretion system protein GspD [Poritiphilus flavus]|uniref:General secretion pathway protein GspD n=1 Tax=Poritiphilus flavus TaxID=2697053 RepID=A0A6L9ECG2_9FLAO|nr:general secretion pathway protein GspD [Poritiphilus flavus]NAS12386.1 general secretion pathway protein GspD [Poritiphilus flavus]